VALVTAACAASPPVGQSARRPTVTTSAPRASTTTLPGSATTDSGPVLTPYPTTTIVNWGDYQPPYNTVAELYADSDHLVFIATVDPLVANDPTPGATFAPFDLSTAQFLSSPPTPPEISLGIPQDQPGDIPLVVGHRYLVFFAIDYSNEPAWKTCTVGGRRGLFDYDAATQTITRTDDDAASQIPRTLSLAQMTAEVKAAAAAAPTDVGSASDPEKWPPAPVCALSATEG
jgi:hypothetical protein